MESKVVTAIAAATGKAVARAVSSKAKEWKFVPNMANVNTPDTYTFRYGDNYRGYIGTHVLCKNLEMRFEMNNAVMISADLFGKFVEDAAPATAYSTDPSPLPQTRTHDAVSQQTDIFVMDPTNSALTEAAHVEEILAIQLDHVRNAASGTAPVDLSSNTADLGAGVNALTITLPTGFEETRYMTGELDLSSYSEARRSFDLDFTFRHSATTQGEYDKYKLGGVEGTRLMNIINTGPQIESIGSGASLYNYEFYVMCACIYIESPQFFTDLNGDNGFSMKAKSIHDPTWNRDLRVNLINTG